MPRVRSDRSVVELFMDRVNRTKSCWLWMGRLDKDGYGEWAYDKERSRAHRWAYKLFIGTLSKNMIVCHRCDQPACVRPSHLFLGTQADNMRDMITKGRRAPKHGEYHHMHKLTEAMILRLRGEDSGRRGEAGRIAKKWNLNPRTVGDIIKYRRWRHLP